MVVFLSIFSLLLVLYAILIHYYRTAWNQIPDFIPNILKGTTSITVIIPVRNEEENIPFLIQSLCEQTYPADLFEVIIVDDHSTDRSWDILQSLTSQPIAIKPMRLADIMPTGTITGAYKKLAIDAAIRLSRGELIVTTDADCIFDPHWLAYIAAFYEATGASFIAAPVKIKRDRRLLSLFQSLDFTILQGITGASVHKRLHTMCNGANLAYQKKVFFEVHGFRDIDNIPSGDDMLLMYKIYKQYPDKVFYLKSRHAIVTTIPTSTWKEFFHQRIRWASKTSYYEERRLFFILVLVYCVNVCFLVLAIASLWDAMWLLWLIILLIAKTVIEFPFVTAVAGFFGETGVMRYFFFLQPLHILYTIVAGWLGKFGSYEWKGRRIKQ